MSIIITVYIQACVICVSYLIRLVKNHMIVFSKPEFDPCVDDADREEVEPSGGVIGTEQ